jgi:trigger factor
LEFKIKDITTSEKEVEVTLTYEEIKKDIESEVIKQTKKIQLPGFRKGKVPLNVLKKMYGDALEYEASEKVASSQFWKVSEENDLKPIGQPHLIDIKFNPGEDLFFKVKYEVVPELDVKDYTNQEIEIPRLEVKNEEIEHELSHIIKANSTTEDSDIVGDDNNYQINVEIQRVDDSGNPIEGIKTETIDIDLSSERVNSEIKENAKGKKAGESFSFTFTDERVKKNEDGSEGKTSELLRYNARINSIKKIVLPELNEELIKKVTKDKVSNESDLREEIRKDIQNYYDQRTEEFIHDKLLHQIVEKNDFTPPQTMVSSVLENMLKREEETAKKQKYFFNREESQKKLKNIAELEVKWFLLKNEIQKKENITISEEDIKELVKIDSAKTGLPEDKLMNYYKSSRYNEKLIDNKLFDFFKKNNKITKVDPEKLFKKETEDTK